MKALAGALFTVLAFQTPPKSWNFDQERAGTIAQTFTNEVGDWKVLADGDAPGKPNVLAQLAKSSGPTFNMTLVANTNYQNVDVAVALKSVAGRTDQGGGVV